MQKGLRGLPLVLTVLIAVGTLAGLWAAHRRFHVEEGNRRVEMALDWTELLQLAQTSREAPAALLAKFKAQGVSALAVTEDTLGALEQTGGARAARVMGPNGVPGTIVTVDSPADLQRIRSALSLRGIVSAATTTAAGGWTAFTVAPNGLTETPPPNAAVPAESIPINYANLRTLGIGLPPEAVKTANAAQVAIAGRIANFPGVNVASAENVLRALRDQGASMVIFTGDDVLGYRGMEKPVAAMLRNPAAPTRSAELPPPTGLIYGAVEFGKQKGDEQLSAALHGDFVRVHSIQAAEMSQMDENEIIDRFVKAARERNIRFCYLRLLTFAGNDPVGDNLTFVKKIYKGMEKGALWTGGGLEFGPAHRYEETGVSAVWFVLAALGAAAGAVWMLRLLCPLPESSQWRLLLLSCVVCAALAAGAGEMGRKLVALLAGIVFPAAACLLTFPRRGDSAQIEFADDDAPGSLRACIRRAVRAILTASAVTALGIVLVVGLLATRPFMLHANQFLGIKAQHAVPLFIVALAALMGGPGFPNETWERFKTRAEARLRIVYEEPARFGVLLLILVGLAALALIVARTGNDSGVGVSGFELHGRALLDRILPVRPRTKEFLLGHPAFILGIAWWFRGRRRWALPAFVVGSIGQVSLLNTFCHIHTPLIVSLWRDGIGLILGTLIGAIVFVAGEIAVSSARSKTSLRM
jgi:hypothetical protein